MLSSDKNRNQVFVRYSAAFYQPALLTSDRDDVVLVAALGIASAWQPPSM
jgi:hypothetical protein